MVPGSRLLLAVLILSLPAARGEDPSSLAEARRGFQTKLIRKQSTSYPVDKPPTGFFDIIQYPSPVGKLSAYVSPRPADNKKHPAIIWLVGGFSNSIGDTAWAEAPEVNDQSARAFRKAGVIMMYPALRGGNENPGCKEGFFGEVDDVLAAAEYLRGLDYVDPEKLYLGGHSTGGTLALLVAACPNRFRAVFSFGPVSEVTLYGQDQLPFDVNDAREGELRSPMRWINSIKVPVFVFEGVEGTSNIESVRELAGASKNPAVHFHEVKGADHYATLAPITRVMAQKILADTAAASNISFTPAELDLSKSK